MAKDNDNTNWQRGLTFSLNKAGDVLLAMGDRESALKHYRESLDIMRRLLAKDKDNTAWQRGAADSLNRMGDLLLATGDRQSALEHYRESLSIMQKLVANDKDNIEWQHEVEVSLERVGEASRQPGTARGRLSTTAKASTSCGGWWPRTRTTPLGNAT